MTTESVRFVVGGGDFHNERCRQRHAHTSHESDLQQGYLRTAVILNIIDTPLSHLLALTFCCCLHFWLLLSVSRYIRGESRAGQRGVVLILCELNLAFCPPTGSFTKKVQRLNLYPLSASSLFTVREVRRGSSFIFILFARRNSVPFRRKDDTTCKTLSDFDLLQCVGVLGGWRNLTHQRKFDKLTFSVKKSELHFFINI